MAAEHLLPGPPPSLADFRLEAGGKGTERGSGSSKPTGSSRGPRMSTRNASPCMTSSRGGR
ncbi:calmodulin like 4 [Homo sapiens]|uniref:Calmodulin-like protein 4 n=1 Tax=Homo sapiens TaxID=9606 RepID=H3BM29_HUMAN|nr:calmodulin like 4 [Homo sapiens]KAI4058443.1 calmodulin like 4 [Homo sapiens]